MRDSRNRGDAEKEWDQAVRVLGRLVLVVVVLLGVNLAHRTARADAVPPPPKQCPKGQVGITSHGGPECVLEAPKNCAPGYRGELRGRCVLAQCTSDDQCEGGRRCLQLEVCQEYRELRWTGWGWSAQRPVARDNFLAGPPRPQPDGPPKKDWVLSSICGQDGPCAAPAECRAAGLCYPPSAIGKTKAKLAAAASPGDPPVASADAQAPVEPEVPGGAPPGGADASGAGGAGGVASQGDRAGSPEGTTSPEPPGGGGGCRKGCATTPGPIWLGWFGAPLLAIVVSLRRRRRPATGCGR